ncbi:MAG: hypothetical protein WC876_05085 [Candidatus Thermoplasmatota archaeon]|jgi:DNA-binding MarR family transcriptional regulator
MASMPARLLVSVLVGLVVAAGGVVAASGGQDSANAPDIEIPPLHVGDQGKYVSATDELRFRFDEMPWVAADGAERRTLVLIQESNETGRQRHWIDGGVVVASEVDVGGGGSGSGLWVAEVGVLGMAFYDVYETRFDGGGAGTLCGLLVNLVGRTLDSPGCGGTLSPSESDPSVFSGKGAMVTLNAALPVAAKIRMNGTTWDLVAFQRGDATPSPGPTGRVFPLMYAEGRGPDEAGVEHPFHLSQALLFALDLPGPSPLRAFMDGHPGAYLASAAFRETVEPGRRSLNWALVASDGKDAAAVNVTQYAAQADDPPFTLSVGTGLVLPASPVPIINEVPAPVRSYPEPDGVSPRFATLASLAERWTAAVPPGAVLDGINAYGFDVVCAEDCSTAATETWIGIDRVRSRQTQQPPACVLVCDYHRRVWVVERLSAAEDGRTLRQLHSDWILYDETSGPLGPLAVGDERQEVPGAGTPLAAAAIWALPSGPVAAGAGLLGLLSALVCYLWPQLKAAILGLWRPKADHPTRERLRTAIAAQPGIHLRELHRVTGLAAGTLRHHLQVLEREGIVLASPAGGYKCYTLARGTARGLAAAAPALKTAAARRILEGVVRSGVLTMGEVAVFAGLGPSTANHHVQRLHDAGLVTRQRSGRSIHVLPTTMANEALAALG